VKFLVLSILLFLSYSAFSAQSKIQTKTYGDHKAEFENKSNALKLGVRTLAVELCVCQNILKEDKDLCLAETFETQPIPPSVYRFDYGVNPKGENVITVSIKLIGIKATASYNDYDTCIIKEEGQE